MRSLAKIAAVLTLSAACAKRVQPPQADPGQAQTVNAGSFVQLSGGASTDPQGRPLAYSWTFVSVPLGSQAVLRDAQTAHPSFLADVPGDYVLQLIVSNSVVVSDPRTVTVTASGCGVYAPVVEQVSTNDETPSIGSTIQLGARVSSRDNDAACGSLGETFAWKWSLVQLPAGSVAALNAPASENPSLRADKDGDYVVQLVVTSSNGKSSQPSQFTVHVSDCGAHIAAGASIGTSADTLGAGPLSVAPMTQVMLSATPADAVRACTLPDARVTWLWQVTSRPAGSTAVLSSKTAPVAGFTPDVAGTYELSVQATDTLSGVASPASFVTLIALPCDSIAPSASAIDVVSGGLLGEPTTVKVRSIADQNCLATGAHTYAWRIVSAPAASTAVLDDPSAAQPAFTPDAVGSYQLQAVVTNSRGYGSPPVFKTLNVQACGTAPIGWAEAPVSRTVTDPQPADGDAQIHAGDTITLAANAADPNGCAADSTFHLGVSYRWSLFSIPAGSKAQLSSPIDATPHFVADVPGTYQYGVVATDALGNSSSVFYESFTTSSCGESAISASISPASASIDTFQEQELDASIDRFDDNQNDPAQPNYCPPRFHQDLALSWAVTNQPANGGGALSAASGAQTRFSGKAPGAFGVRLTAAAPNGVTASANAALTVKSCGATPPTIVSTATGAGATQADPPAPSSRPAVGSWVTLTANGVSPDTLSEACGSFSTSLTYQWTLVSAPAGSTASTAGVDPASGSLQFQADLAGTYVFSVTATDSNGLVSQPVTITIPTGACGPQIGSSAIAGVFDGDASATVGNSLALTAPALTSADDSCVASASYTYAWQLSSRPGASGAALTSISGSTSSFVADVPGAYIVTVTATDNGGFSSQVSQTFNVGACTSGPAPSPLYTSPAGANGKVYLGDQVGLSPGAITAGSCNHLTSTAYSYSWALVAKPGSSAAQLSSNNAASPVVVPDVAGQTYKFAVTVRDGLGNTGTGAVDVPVSACGGRAPVLSAVSAQDGKTSSAITVTSSNGAYSLSQPTWDPIAFTGSAISPDNNTDAGAGEVCPASFHTSLSYAWQVVAGPVGAQFSLGGATTATPTFAPAAKGAYQLALTVTDGHGNKAAPVPVNVNILCGDAIPKAVDNGATAAFSATQTVHQITQKTASGTSTGDLTVTASTLQVPTPVAFYPSAPITLSANAQDDDTACGFSQTISYTWAFTSTPLGSQVVFDSAISPTPTFVPDKPGDYYIQLTLRDSKGASGTQVFPGSTIVHVGSCGSQTPVALIGLEDPFSAAPTTTVGANNGYAVVLDGTSSYTLDNAPVDFTGTSGVLGCGYNKTLSYQWSFVSVPSGAGVAFNDATRVNPAFTPQVSGSYVMSLTASDGVRTSQPATVEVVTSDAVNGSLDFYAKAGDVITMTQPAGQQQHFNSFRIEPGATVYLGSGVNGGLLDLIVTGDVYIGGTLNLSGSPGNQGPNGDVSWQGSGGGDTGFPNSNHGTPIPGAGCSGTGSQITISQAGGGSGSAGATGGTGGGSCSPGAGGAYGGGMGGGPGGGGGGGYGGGGGGGGNTCGGNAVGGGGGGAYGGAGGGIAQGGFGGNGGGAPYDGVQGGSPTRDDCSGSGYGGGGGGGSIGADASADLAMSSTLRAGSAGGGGAGDEGRGGGGGGGAVRIISTTGNITVTGQVLANGGAGGDSGGDPVCCQGGSGGGGSGGAIWLQANSGSVYNAGTISAAGGRGGVAQSSRGGGGAQNGGAGGIGRIKLVAAPGKVSNYGIMTPPLGASNGRGLAWVGTP